MKKYLSVLAAVVLFSCGKEASNPSGDNQPQGGGGNKPTDELTVTCTTGQATEIDPTSAKLSGTATIANAKEANGKACFYYSATQGDAQALKGGSKADADNVAATGGSFTVTISGLSPETTYYYVAAVTIDSKETFGEVKSFTTAELPKGPTTTGAATNITEWSAVLSAYANPTADMGTVTMGIIYSTDENPTLDNGVQLTSKELDGNNMYTVKATQLASNTTYYYKSTLESAGVIRSGEIKSFKTKEIDISVTTGEATEVGKKEATISGEFLLNTSEDLDKEVGFLVSTSVNTANGLIETGTKYIVKDPSEGIFSYHFSYLNYETTYYYMAYASVHDKIVYGDIKEFRTLDLIELSVLEEENITQTTATLYATFNREELSSLVGSYSLEWRGFIYSDTVDTLEELIESGEVETGWLWGNEFGITLHDLKTNTKYYYVAALTLTVNNREYKYYTDVHSFETLPLYPATSLSLDKTSLELPQGESYKLVATVLPENTTDKLTWETSDPDVATVDENGIVTAKMLLGGEAIISAIAGDQKAECNVTITLIDGPVDLGLSVKWASCNVGATKPEEYGDYYAWGETEVKYDYSWSTYKFGSSDSGPFSKYNTNEKYGNVDNKRVLDPEDDVAHIVLGGKWRMPTGSEKEEIINQCTWKWATWNGVSGCLVTGKNGKVIFLPATGICSGTDIKYVGSSGWYWTSSLEKNYYNVAIPYEAQAFGPGSHNPYGFKTDHYRCVGLTIRPVTE